MNILVDYPYLEISLDNSLKGLFAVSLRDGVTEKVYDIILTEPGKSTVASLSISAKHLSGILVTLEVDKSIEAIISQFINASGAISESFTELSRMKTKPKQRL